MFPIAISQFFLEAATTDVKSSGREVPRATIVKPINLSLNPNCRAIKEAEITTKRLPKITIARPPRIITKSITIDFGFSSAFSSEITSVF